ncbi:hypothetical protein [Thalassobaculum litoreum]|uniref:Uncharacterized protein n=1 Tax=Thalassobaculum litoreum DSM 18839 TaxID=1123362 RepID=A0A8G2F073_9PROT|nr:hypothetical protein [Thalassobaculum litoreum]SDG53494.1 hypothetical protein SAMN05660686_04743 [Thalassobaculum litoreum DSM 18839]
MIAHPFVILLAAVVSFLAPSLYSAMQTKTDAVTSARASTTRASLIEAAQILATQGSLDLASGTLILSAAGSGSTLPADLPAQTTDSWNTAITYCRGGSQTMAATALALVSAGPDRRADTSCTTALSSLSSGDDIVITLSHSDAATWAAQSANRLGLVNTVEALNCVAPDVVAYSGGTWTCVNVDDLISESLDGTSTSCPIANGTGEKAWDGATKSWSTCVVTGCNAGYTVHNNTCIPTTTPCSVSNGSGQQTWNGSGYGSCTATSCNAGYHIENGQCVPDGLQAGSCYRITCTSQANRTQTLIGNAQNSQVVRAGAPSGGGAWVLGVGGNSQSGFYLTQAYNCIKNESAIIAQHSGNGYCQAFGPAHSGEAYQYSGGYFNYFAYCQVPQSC